MKVLMTMTGCEAQAVALRRSTDMMAIMLDRQVKISGAWGLRLLRVLLSGPPGGVGPGKLPVGRVTGTLARAQRGRVIAWAHYRLWSDPNIARSDVRAAILTRQAGSVKPRPKLGKPQRYDLPVHATRPWFATAMKMLAPRHFAAMQAAYQSAFRMAHAGLGAGMAKAA